jgi:transposase
VLKPPPRSAEDQSLRIELQQHPALVTAIHLAQQFADLVRQRLPERLDRWLEQASNSSIKQFQNFAKSLEEDYAVVKAGVTLAVSNGQVEGQINRLKMLKWQMYGRAGFDRLQKRVILAS